MQTSAVLHNLEASVEAQLALAGSSDPGIETVGRAMLAALRPALREAAFELANQAAEEVRAQLPGHRVDLTVTEGEPTLRITVEETTMHSPRGGLRRPDHPPSASVHKGHRRAGGFGLR